MKRELGSTVGAGADAAEYSSSSSDEGGEETGGFSAPMHTWQTTASPLNSDEGEEEEDSEDEYTIKVRDADIMQAWWERPERCCGFTEPKTSFRTFPLSTLIQKPDLTVMIYIVGSANLPVDY